MSQLDPQAPSSSPPLPSAQPRDLSLPHDDDDEFSSHENSEHEPQSAAVDESPTVASPSKRNPYIEDKDSEFDLLPHSPARPNKFQGPPSTWRGWTAADRAIATSLDRIRAQDLSVHLYNAYVLKKRARLSRTREDEVGKQGLGWEPPKQWTAWPMSDDEVPKAERGRWEDESDQVTRVTSMSEELEEVLLGVVSKEARGRFEAREWEGKDGREEIIEAERVRGGINRARTRSQSRARMFEGTAEDGDEFEPVATTGSRTELEEPISFADTSATSQTSPAFSSSPSPSSTNSPRPNTKPSSRNSSTRRKREPRSPSTHPLYEEPFLKPVILADDAVAANFLHPTIRHILSKLDALLAALHHARVSSLRPLDDSQSETQTSADESRSASRSRASSKARGRKRVSSRVKGKRAQHSDVQDSGVVSDVVSEVEAGKPRPSRSGRRFSNSGSRARIMKDRQARMGLRDWSDVLGVAAIAGWDAGAVEKAAGRCAGLFREGMDFRVLGIGGEVERKFESGPRGRFENNREGKSGREDQGKEGDEMIGGVHVDGFLRPIKARKGWRGGDKGPRKSRKEKRSREDNEGDSEGSV